MFPRPMHRAGNLLAGLLLAVLAVSPAPAADLETYRLTDATLDKYERATEIMYDYATQHPEVLNAMDDDEDDTDMDFAAMAKRFDEKAPGLRKQMEATGLPLEEYFTFAISMAANAFGAAMAEQFGADESKLTAVQRDNMAFIRKNQERFEQFSQRMEQKYGPLMSSDEDSDYYEDEDEYYEDDSYDDESEDSYESE